MAPPSQAPRSFRDGGPLRLVVVMAVGALARTAAPWLGSPPPPRAAWPARGQKRRLSLGQSPLERGGASCGGARPGFPREAIASRIAPLRKVGGGGAVPLSRRRASIRFAGGVLPDIRRDTE